MLGKTWPLLPSRSLQPILIQITNFTGWYIHLMGFPGGASGKEPACQCKRCKWHGFESLVGQILWRRAWQPTPVFLPGISHIRGDWLQPLEQQELDTTQRASHHHVHLNDASEPLCSRPGDHKLSHARESPGGLAKAQITGPHLQSFWFSKSEARPKSVHFW